MEIYPYSGIFILIILSAKVSATVCVLFVMLLREGHGLGMWRWLLLLWTLKLQHIFCVDDSWVEYFNGTIGSSASYTLTSLSKSEVYAMRFEFEINFKFPAVPCCPILDPVRPTNSNSTCFNSKELSISLPKLSPDLYGATYLTCQYSTDRLWITCAGTTGRLFPKARSSQILLIGYECGKMKQLTKFTYEVKGIFSNSTLCNSVQVDECPDLSYSSFPNAFGSRNVYGACP